MSSIAVISNPRSRKNRHNPNLVKNLAKILGNRGVVYQPHDLATLQEAIEQILQQKPEVLALNGGDGTTHLVLTELLNHDPNFVPALALLRGGTMNTVASGMKIRGTPEGILQSLVDQRGEWVERSLLKVLVSGGKTDHQGAKYGFLFGNGLVSNYLAAYYEGTEPTPLKAVMILGKGCFSVAAGMFGVFGDFGARLMRPVVAEVEVEGHRFPSRSYLSVAAGTVDDIGFGFRPFYESLAHPGQCHALLLGCSPWGFVRNLPRVWLARPIQAPGAESFVTRRLVMRADQPIDFMVDGDFLPGGTELAIEIGPRVRIWRGV